MTDTFTMRQIGVFNDSRKKGLACLLKHSWKPGNHVKIQDDKGVHLCSTHVCTRCKTIKIRDVLVETMNRKARRAR